MDAGVADDAIPAAVRAEIDARLAALEAEEDAQVLLAVESGSRAWGFASPDSDYDVRLVYLRRRDWYLRLAPGRDVIERPIVDEIDLNGWDVRKFLGLVLRSNAVTGEWLSSPIRYRSDHPAMARIAALAGDYFCPRRAALHYASQGAKVVRQWLDGPSAASEAAVPVKRYFYALRPALAIRTLRLRPDRPPPMNLQQLAAASDLPETLAAQIEALVAAKSVTCEAGNTMRLPDLDSLIRRELGLADTVPMRTMSAQENRQMEQRADQIFLDLVNDGN